jgi:hypothetical protein
MSSAESQRGSRYDLEDRGAGWLVFASIMLGLGGLLGLIHGITAVSKSSFFAPDAHYVFSNLNTWGWFMIIVGGAAILSAFGVLSGQTWARWIGIAIAALQAIVHLTSVQAYPFWALCVFAIDLLVIYGLATYGGKSIDLDM